MRLFALIGYPLTHSFSQRFFTEKFAREHIADARYELFPISSIADLPQLLSDNTDLCGLNVTIPYKEAVIPYLNALDETAREVGAVNCIRIQNGLLTGYNTDVYGFETSLLQTGFLSASNEPVQGLILGTGGAAKAVAYVLRKLQIPYRFVSRQPKDGEQVTYAELAEWLGYGRAVIINASPLGTFPNVEQMPPVPLEYLGPQHLVFDLVYNPPETLLLREARARGCMVQNGAEMLRLQAEKAWAIWNETITAKTEM